MPAEGHQRSHTRLRNSSRWLCNRPVAGLDLINGRLSETETRRKVKAFMKPELGLEDQQEKHTHIHHIQDISIQQDNKFSQTTVHGKMAASVV